MAIDKAVDSSALDASLTAVADAIREKTGKSAAMTLAEMPTEIEGISGGGDTSAEDGIIDRTISGEYTNSRVTKVGSYAFRECAALTSVSLPNATSISDNAFLSCWGLTTANFPNVTSIGAHGFQICRALTTANFPNVTSIGDSAFYRCSKLTSADFPQVTSIGNSAFRGCESLVSASFPNVTSIPGAIFDSCSKLTSADFPQVTSIGYNAFNACSALTALILRNTSTVCSLSNTNAFASTPIKSGTGYIYVPDALVDSYKVATNWSTYAAQIKPLSEYTGG